MSTITAAELHATTVELLPKRDTLSWWGINKSKVVAFNTAVALQSMTIGSTNVAYAGQQIQVWQH